MGTMASTVAAAAAANVSGVAAAWTNRRSKPVKGATSVQTTGTPAARYSRVFKGKLRRLNVESA